MVNTTPTVSVIVPNYNHARFLPKRIESIFGQSFQNFELILLDDCSTDDSRSILCRYASDPRVRVEFNEVNSGSSFKQWNKGVSLARGEYVWIAESDDYADRQLLETLVTTLGADPTVMLAYCRSWRVTEDDQKNGFGDWYLDYLDPQRWTANFVTDGVEECQNYFVYSNPVPNASAVVFRRAGYQRVGGADETLRLCGDWKLWAAMALNGKVLYLAEPLNYFRYHDASVRSVTYQTGVDVAEILQVRWWILDQATRPETPMADPSVKRQLANSCMDLAFRCYPGFPDITRLALQRAHELGGADFTPTFSTWKGELLTRMFGWKATRQAQALYHRFLKTARNTMGQDQRWLNGSYDNRLSENRRLRKL